MISGCAIFDSSDDFAVTGKITQSITIENDLPVVIRCYCENRTINKNPNENILELKITGTHASVGYHGEQEKPEFISPGLLRFVEKRNSEGLILESREYTYIHHAYIINSLQISAPAETEVRVMPLSLEELEGRTVE